MYILVFVYIYMYKLVFVYYGVLVHEGNVVMVEGGILHEPKAGALSSLECYYIARVH